LDFIGQYFHQDSTITFRSLETVFSFFLSCKTSWYQLPRESPGQPGQGNKSRTVGLGRPERTARTVKSEHGSKVTGELVIRLVGQESQDKIAEKDNRDRIAMAG
jgi:hypothetical protein